MKMRFGNLEILPKGVRWKRFFSDLYREISEDHVFSGAAALAFYNTLALFPALILILSLVAFLPVEKVDIAIMEVLREALPGDAAALVDRVVNDLSSQKKGGLLSFGLIGTLWAATSGTSASMEQLNVTYDVTEERPYFKGLLTAFGLTILLGSLMIVSFLLVVLGGHIQEWLVALVGSSSFLLTAFAVSRWLIIVTGMLFAFALAYYFGPDVEQEFRFVTPGSILGTLVLLIASLGFRVYVTNFGTYDAMYGSIGAMIVLMLWLYIGGLVLLLGSEVNALIEHYHPDGKVKGEKHENEGVPKGKMGRNRKSTNKSPNKSLGGAR